jgi:3-phenylpropionate/trans-cinnamate dioxygenase ferredoxin reductase subunit
VRQPTIAIVGGSLGGLRSAEQLRIAGHIGPITVFGAEPHLPYTRPPLSKEVLADPTVTDVEAMLTRLVFRRRAVVDDVEFRLGAEVVSADLASGTLTLSDGTGARYHGLVVATGLRPRRLHVPGPVAGRHTLRTIEDCLTLRAALTPGSRVVVVGAGFIGSEAACTLAGLGHHVTVIEPTGPPMNQAIGTELAAAVRRHHEAAGIEFVIGPGVAGFHGSAALDPGEPLHHGQERLTGVSLTDGTTVEADVVVESVGSVCNTEWLEGNGLDLSDGVLVDNGLAVAEFPSVVVVGDVARFPNPLFDNLPRRVEHWSMPTDTAKRAAATLAARLRGDEPDPTPFVPVPSFWSDQLDLRLQSFGSPGLGEEVRIEGDLRDLTAGVLTTHYRGGRHVGTIAVNLPAARQRGLRQAFVEA